MQELEITVEENNETTTNNETVTPSATPADDLKASNTDTVAPTVIYQTVDNIQLELLVSELNSSVVILNEQVALTNTSILFVIGLSCSVFILVLLYKFIRSFI